MEDNVEEIEDNSNAVLREFTELREMMQDLQLGFSEAMTELSNIQDEDKVLHEKIDDSKREHENQMRDVLELVQSLKAQCDNIQLQLALSNKNQRRMEKQIKKLKTERQTEREGEGGGGHKATLQTDNMNSSDYTNETTNRSNVYTTSPMLKSYIASLPHPEDMEDVEDHHSDSDESLAAVTQRSLVLSNTLAQRAYSVPHVHSLHMGDNSNNFSDKSSKSGSNTAAEYHNGELSADERHNFSTTNKALIERQRIAVSLTESERSYCTTLYNIMEGYKKVFSGSGSLSEKDLSRVFPASLTTIYEYHCAVLKRLEGRMSRWRQQDILGDIFAKFSVTKQVDIFAQYRMYIDNFTAALQTVRKLNKSCEKFRATLKKCQRESGGDNLSLITQLLAPVRRIPSLILYIKKLLKHTDVDHPDKFFLESSLNHFRSSLLSMNESMERSIQLATSDCSSSKRSLETCSWSSHEEDQRLSTATKDSGIHSNCDLEYHEELSALPTKLRVHNSSLKKNTISDDTSSSPREPLIRRPQSVIDFIRPEQEMTSSVPARCKTPTPSMLSKNSNRSSVSRRSVQNLPLKPSLSQSTPNLLDDSRYTEGVTSLKHVQKRKHKVQFKNPPIEEQEQEHSTNQHAGNTKRIKKRSISDTLRIIFNRRRSSNSKNSNSDMSDSCCDLTSSFDEGSLRVSSYTFNKSNSGSTSQLSSTQEETTHYINNNTYEDEDGEPYSVV